ncbi:MAG: tRNA uridine-5-carboxymethylaminomethyl(34) synthesis GTPase MnmE, partial [Candidatus Hydrogenedentes bacterium]|nr:tRNA uridine-5-carboxymethylaminomethyl(34) synthesis GTPase MnmE [Candidatus Hydrogenedentota bacterium]
MLKSPEDTIAAVSTPPGEGGIGIVRLSGPDAVAIAGRVFVSTTGRDIAHGNRRVFHGHVASVQGGIIDEVLLHVMNAPHSYTREDVVEINCHGGAGPVAAVLDETLRQGARLAQPGECTLRAFLNGRIDLIQAEAVVDHIRARTHAGLRAASAAASGALSKELHAMKDDLVDALARIEAAVDFPDDDLPDLVDEPLRIRLDKALERMRALLSTAEAG